MSLLQPVPERQDPIEKTSGKLHHVWLKWLRDVKDRVEALPADSLAAATAYTDAEVAAATVALEAYADAAAAAAIAGAAEVNDGDSASVASINWLTGPNRYVLLTASWAPTFVNPSEGGLYWLTLEQATGGDPVTWPADVLWEGGAAPSLGGSAGDIDLIGLRYTAAGGGKYLAFAFLGFA